MNALLAHGGSEAHVREARRLARQVADALGEPVEAGFLDGPPPRGVRWVLPLFLADGAHMRRDAPAWAEAAGARLLPGPDAGAVAALGAALAERARQAAKHGRAARAVAFALHRLRDARALMAALYSESKRFPLPAVAGLHGECRLEDVLALWRREGVKEAVVQPMLLFEGRNLARLREIADAAGMAVHLGPALGANPEFAGMLAAAFRRAA